MTDIVLPLDVRKVVDLALIPFIVSAWGFYLRSPFALVAAPLSFARPA